MKLSSQVVSLELAKKLKKLKVKQNSIWYWTNAGVGLGEKFQLTTDYMDDYLDSYYTLSSNEGKWYSAFTVAELLEVLPESILTKNKYYDLLIQKLQSYYECYYSIYKSEDQNIHCAFTYDEFLANALAKMLIYLIENNLIKRSGNEN